MMPRSKKLLGSGDQEYFNEKRPVNVRVDSIAHLAELFPSPARDADEYPAITVVLSEWSATPKLSLDHAAKSWLLALSKTDRRPAPHSALHLAQIPSVFPWTASSLGAPCPKV